MKRLAVALLFVAGLAATLALPGLPGLGPSSPEAAAFGTLVRGLDGTLPPAEHEHALATLRALGPKELARFLEVAVPREAEEGPRRAALECLAGCATSRELALLVRLATPAEGSASEPVRQALRAALVPTLERDPRAFRELVPAWNRSPAELRPEFLAAVGESGAPAGLELLAWVATFEGEAYHRPVAEACLRVTPTAPDEEARERLESLCVLLRSPDAVCVQALSAALLRARVEAAVPPWIELLASPSRGTRERARRSLEELTGLALGPAPERWHAWLEAENTWFEERAPSVLAELESGSDARALAALRELSQRSLRRDELSLAVAPLLGHAAKTVRLCAVTVLAHLRSHQSLPALVAALEDEDEAVARAAWSALRGWTGLDLPLDEALWREQVAG